jgi:hypothetical protein
LPDAFLPFRLQFKCRLLPFKFGIVCGSILLGITCLDGCETFIDLSLFEQQGNMPVVAFELRLNRFLTKIVFFFDVFRADRDAVWTCPLF